MIEILAAIIFLAAIFFIAYSFSTSNKAKVIKKECRIPEGKITYTDLDKPGKALYSRTYNLAGKPDYIVRRDYGYIPVEVKNTETDRPYKSHVLQLGSYCLLLEDLGKAVPFGVISYRNYQFKIPFDDYLKHEVLGAMERIRDEISLGKVRRNHNQPKRCVFCSLNKVCTMKLT